MPISPEVAAQAAEVRVAECMESLEGSIQRRIKDSWRPGEDLVVEDVYDCFSRMSGGVMGRKEEMDEAIYRIMADYAKEGWTSHLTYPVTRFRKRTKADRPILTLRPNKGPVQHAN